MTDPTPANVDNLWINANLATMASSGFPYGAVEDSAIAVAGGRIAWVGAEKDLPGGIERRAGQVHDAGGCWITPGLIDCHGHAGHSMLGIFSTDSLSYWGRAAVKAMRMMRFPGIQPPIN